MDIYEIKISFNDPMTKRMEDEMRSKGYAGDVIVECSDGSMYRLCFYDPVRLMQDVTDEGVIIEPGLVIVQEVTLDNIRRAVYNMINVKYFDSLTPL